MKHIARRLETPEDLQNAIDEYFDSVDKQVVTMGKKVKTGGPFDSEEHMEASGVPTFQRMLLFLGLLEREWVVISSSPALSRICEMAMMRLEAEWVERGLNKSIDGAFVKDVLRKEIKGWKAMASEGSKNLNGAPLAGAILNGPVKIEIHVARNDKSAGDIETSESSERQQLEEIGIAQPKKVALELNSDDTMKKD